MHCTTHEAQHLQGAMLPLDRAHPCEHTESFTFWCPCRPSSTGHRPLEVHPQGTSPPAMGRGGRGRGSGQRHWEEEERPFCMMVVFTASPPKLTNRQSERERERRTRVHRTEQKVIHRARGSSTAGAESRGNPRSSRQSQGCRAAWWGSTASSWSPRTAWDPKAFACCLCMSLITRVPVL